MKKTKKAACALAALTVILNTAGGMQVLRNPAADTALTAHAFEGEMTYGQLTYFINGNQITITGCDKTAEEVTVPAKIDGLPVVTIMEGAFGGCRELKSITLPEGLEWIDEYAFGNCSALTSIVIPSTVTYIGIGAFSGCTGLTEVEMTHVPETLYATAFSDTPWLKGLFGDSGFAVVNGTLIAVSPELQEAESIVIPYGVRVLGAYLFTSLPNLTSVTIPDSVTAIGKSNFNNCRKLTSVEIPDSVTRIEDLAFMGCAALEQVTLPAHLQYVGRVAFSDTPWMKQQMQASDCVIVNNVLFYANPERIEGEFVIPDGVTVIAGAAFAGNVNLTDISIPDSVKSIGAYAFFSCSALTGLMMPDSITEIGECAFRYCESLTYVRFSYGLTTLEQMVFAECTSLQVITVPFGINEVKYGALVGCGQNGSINFLNPNCRINADEQSFGMPGARPIIRGFLYSTAQTMAESLGYEFEPIVEAILRGDVDFDGEVTATDAQRTLTAYLNQVVGSPSGFYAAQITAADVNTDGKVDAADAQIILRYYLNNTVAKNPVTWEALISGEG